MGRALERHGDRDRPGAAAGPAARSPPSHPELELIEATSHEALPELDAADAIIIDGDHNYFTLSEELRLIDERTPGAGDAAADAARHRLAAGPPRRLLRAGADPGRAPPAARPRHLPGPGRAGHGRRTGCRSPASPRARAGRATASSPRSRTSSPTAHELEFARVPAFFGFGVIWHREAAWAARVAAEIAPWDRNPVLERLEANRIRHMVERYRMTRRLEIAVDRRARRNGGPAGARRLARVRGRRAALARCTGAASPAFTREQVRRALDAPDGAGLPRRGARRRRAHRSGAVIRQLRLFWIASSCFQWATRSSSSSPPISRAAAASASARRARHSQSRRGCRCGGSARPTSRPPACTR